MVRARPLGIFAKHAVANDTRGIFEMIYELRIYHCLPNRHAGTC